jgi:hypothetical protein
MMNTQSETHSRENRSPIKSDKSRKFGKLATMRDAFGALKSDVARQDQLAVGGLASTKSGDWHHCRW